MTPNATLRAAIALLQDEHIPLDGGLVLRIAHEARQRDYADRDRRVAASLRRDATRIRVRGIMPDAF